MTSSYSLATSVPPSTGNAGDPVDASTNGNSTATQETSTESALLLESATLAVEDPVAAPILEAMVSSISLVQQQALGHSAPLFASLQPKENMPKTEWSPYNQQGSFQKQAFAPKMMAQTGDLANNNYPFGSSTTVVTNTSLETMGSSPSHTHSSSFVQKLVSPFRQVITASATTLLQAAQEPHILGSVVNLLQSYGLHNSPQINARVSFFKFVIPMVAASLISKHLKAKTQQQLSIKNQSSTLTKRPVQTSSPQSSPFISSNPGRTPTVVHPWNLQTQNQGTDTDTAPLPSEKDKFKEGKEDGQQQQQSDQEGQDGYQEAVEDSPLSGDYNPDIPIDKETPPIDADSFSPEFIFSYVPSLGQNIEDLLLFGLEASILSRLIKLRTSHFDVLLLFLEVLKLTLKNREQERLSRIEERLLQIQHMQEVVTSFKGQGKSLLIAGISSGVMAIFSGVSPVIGQIKGDWILGQIGRVFSRMKDMEAGAFFDQVSKVTLSMSEMSKATGQIQTAFAEGHRAFDQHMQEMYKIEADERTRNIEEIKENWRNLENFIYQSLQMYHDTTRQSYQQ